VTTAYQRSIDAEATRLFANDPAELRRYRQLVQKQQGHEAPVVAKPKKKLPRYIRQQVEAGRKHLANIHQRNMVVKNSKKVAAKALRKSLAQNSQPRLQKEFFAKSIENAVMKRIGELEGQLANNRQLAKSSGQAGSIGYDQASGGVAFLLNREHHRLRAFMKGTAIPADYAAVAGYLDSPDHPARTEAERSIAAAARAVSGAQGTSISQHLGALMSAPREALAAVRDDNGRPETLQTFEVQTHRLEKQLEKATSPAQREKLGYQITRRRLLAMHARGEG
jgi:hypothetical protein